MAQPSKFSGALARLREAPTTELPPEPGATVAPVPSAIAGAKALTKGRGRPPGKRSDPEFKPTTLLLREQTKRTALRKLEDSGEEKDLSVLVEKLLMQWNQQNL